MELLNKIFIKKMINNFYEQNLKIKDYKGKEIDLKGFKGTELLIVNIASKCKLANNAYRKIKNYKSKGVNILMCPCSQFFNQEHKNVQDTLDDLKKRDLEVDNKQVFITEPVSVKGNKIHPIFKFLIKEKNSLFFKNVHWNFTLFLIDKEGIVTERINPIGHLFK